MVRKRETLGRFRVKKGWIREQHLGVTRLIRRSFFRSDPIFPPLFFYPHDFQFKKARFLN